jgi:hypothetical protein
VLAEGRPSCIIEEKKSELQRQGTPRIGYSFFLGFIRQLFMEFQLFLEVLRWRGARNQ